MARIKHKPRKIELDSNYPDVLVTRLINYIMLDGKKPLARSIVYNAFSMINKKGEAADPLQVFRKALQEIKPTVEVKTRTTKGAPVRYPSMVSSGRQNILALRWMVEAARVNKGKKTMAESLADEILAASNGEGEAIKKKNNLYKSAQSHKAYSHLK
ncbi:MAG: 30S ribosomal protein S7 [Cytophagales bacterium]